MKNQYKKILDSLLPALVFMVLYKTISFKTALIVGFIHSGYTYGMEYKRNKKLNNMSIIGLLGVIFQTISGLLFSNEKAYFFYPILSNLIFTSICFGSLLGKKSIIGYIAKDFDENDSNNLEPIYKRLTIIWGSFFSLKVIVKLIGIMNWSFELLYGVNWLIGTPITMTLIWFSFYYTNKMSKEQA